MIIVFKPNKNQIVNQFFFNKRIPYKYDFKRYRQKRDKAKSNAVECVKSYLNRSGFTIIRHPSYSHDFWYLKDN